MGEDAIYVRQSVDRDDSISVESQAEFCQREISEGTPKIYTDKGYSGKNTDRPGFRQMMADIEAGKIRRVIVYRLDRISRSVLDFAGIIDIFQKHGVDFVSTMEKFDTGTPIGKAMLMIVMIFAQLERETIQQRVIDAYLSRSRRGFYMGGRVPYGFQLKDTVIDGIKTKMYEPVPEEITIVQKMFAIYSDPQASFGDILQFLNVHGIQTRLGKSFSRSPIRDIITNPVYVKADYKIYEFFKSQGTNIINPPEDFVGLNGAYLYSGNELKRKTISLAGHNLVLAPHEGIVDSSTWIKCRGKCLNNHRVAKPLKAKASWLAGKIKCGNCGYALVAKTYQCKTKADNRYFLCTHKYASGNCNFTSLDADFVESIVFDEIVKKLSEFNKLTKSHQEAHNSQTVKLKIQLEQIEAEIASLLEKIPQANNIVMGYINQKACELDEKKRQLYAELSRIANEQDDQLETISGYLVHWNEVEMRDKLTIVDSLIESLSASKDKISIKWKI